MHYRITYRRAPSNIFDPTTTPVPPKFWYCRRCAMKLLVHSEDPCPWTFLPSYVT